MRIALVEDHLLLRDVLRRACGGEFGHEVVAEASEAVGVPDLVVATRPDLVLLDLQLPDGDGLDVLDEIRRRRPTQRALILSFRCDPYTVFRVERAGASGFIDKGSHSLAMVGRALAAIEQGRSYYSPAYLAARAARRRDPLSFDKILSEREQTVLGWIGRSLGDGEIAARLGISPQTVEKHRFNVLRKLRLHGTPELVRYARDQGFTAADPAFGGRH